ncbi:MAG: hypothetical protein WC522_02935 [Candidatus Omnitrophota bacterium]
MAEEKKEEAKPQVEAAKPVEQKPPEPKPAAPEVKAAAEAVKPADAKKKEEPKIEKPANCVVCNKSIKKKRWYYRAGKYYCTKRCWQKASKKDETPEAPAPAA